MERTRTFRIFIDETVGIGPDAGRLLVERAFAKNLQDESFQFVKVIDNGAYFFVRKDVDDATVVDLLKRLSIDYNYHVAVTTVADDRFTVHISL